MIPDLAEKLKMQGQEVAPADDTAPDFLRVSTGFRTCLTDSSDIINQARLNYENRFSLWAGQHTDGKKHGREGDNPTPTPWEGASDLRTFLIDEAINAKVAQICTAVGRANLTAVPINTGDYARAKAVTNFMRWLVYTQIHDFPREIELLGQYLYEKGYAVSGQFWETCQEKTLQIYKLEDLVQKFGPQVTDLLHNPGLEDHLVGVIQQEHLGTSTKKARTMIQELQEHGETSISVAGKEYSRPVFRAFSLDQDLFIHPSATDIENAPAIYRVQYFTPVQLRSFANSEEWNEDWVEEAIKVAKGKRLNILPDENPAPVTRSIINQAERFTDLVGVVFSYERLSDEDGVPGVYLTIFNPDVVPGQGKKHKGFAKFGLLGYAHGAYPFKLHRREYISRRLHDSRGLPEVGKPFQDIVKACRDSRIDAASLSVLPPMMYPQGRPPATWGPGAKIAYRRDPREYSFGDRPTYDINNTTVEQQMVNNWREYNGLATPDGDPTMARLKQQFEVGKFLEGIADAFGQIWELFKQYGQNQTWYRVIGVGGENMQQFDKGEAGESYDFYLTYDVISADSEAQATKIEMIAKAVATADKYGQVDYSKYLPLLLNAIDPSISDLIVQPKEASSQKAVNEEQTALAQIFAGIDKDIDLGAPPELGMQVIQGYVQSPDVAARLQTDKLFAQRIEKRMKQYQFQVTQKNNAQIGRLGA